MSTGTGHPAPKVGGSPRTMVIGMGAVGAGLLAFYFGQFRVHKGDDQTWVWRHGQQPGNQAVPMHGPRLVGREVELHQGSPPNVPVRGNAGDNGEAGLLEKAMSVNLGKGINPDSSVPENPGNIQQPAPQRRNDSGSHYTKAGDYADSYRKRPENPDAPKEGRS